VDTRWKLTPCRLPRTRGKQRPSLRSFPSLTSTTSDITSEYGSVPRPVDPPTPTRRQAKHAAQPVLSPSSLHSARPPRHPIIASPRPSNRPLGSASQSRQHSRPAPLTALPVRKQTLHVIPTTLCADSPPPSPVPDSPPPDSDDYVIAEAAQRDLNDYVNLVHQDAVPDGTFITIHQDKSRGPQDRWYIVTKGREVGIFNSW